jgi:hypothetical protein
VIAINEQKQAPNLDQSLPINVVIEPKDPAVPNSYHLISRTNYEYQALIQTTSRKSLVYSNVSKNKSMRNISLDSRLKKVTLFSILKFNNSLIKFKF